MLTDTEPRKRGPKPRDWVRLDVLITPEHAMKHRLIAANPCTVVDKPRIAHVDPIFLEPEEVAAVAAELDGSHPYGLIVRFAAYTGLRAGELAALRVRDVNLMRRHVEVRRTVQRTKGGWTVGTPKSARSVRDVPLPGFLVAELTEYLAGHPHRADPSAALWPGRLPGRTRRAAERRGLVAPVRRVVGV